MHFDARHAKALKAGEVYAIPGCPGLRLEATQTTKTWTYRYRHPVNGKLRQTKLGTWPAMPPVAAAAEWQRLRGLRDSGADPADDGVQPTQADPEYTLGQMVSDYHRGHLIISRKAQGARETHARLQRAIKGHERMKVASVGRKFVHDLIMKLSATPVTAKSVHTELGSAWEYCANSGALEEALPNWFRRVKFPSLRSRGQLREGKPKGTDKRILRPPEIRLLVGGQLHLFSQPVQDVLILYLWTATRGGESCQMHTDHITREADGLWWTPPKSMTKLVNHESAAGIRVPLVGRAEKVVERLLGERLGWLFPSVTRSGEATHMKQAYIQSKVHYRQPYSKAREGHVRERLKVTHWSPHDLRRTARTMLTGLGCPERVAEEIIGHVKPGVVGIYDLYRYDKERRHWLTQLDAELERIISGDVHPPGAAS